VRTEDDLRAALVALERHAPAATRVMPARRGWRLTHRPVWLTGLAGVASLAAVAGVITAATASGRSPGHIPNGVVAPAPGKPSAPIRASLTAKDVLLRAAAGAAAATAAGRYWVVSDVNAYLTAAGPDATPFAAYQRYTPEVYWDARSSSDRSWVLPAAGYTTAPAPGGATATWRADGSPRLANTTGQQQAWWQTGGAVGFFGNANLTFAQFQALPSSTAGLAAAIGKEIKSEQIPAGTTGAYQRMFDICTQLLKWDPITPAVRAATFRVLATIPGVSLAGKVTDPLGRTGYGIAFDTGTGPGSAGGQEEVLVIAPGSGTFLTDEYVVTSLPAGISDAPAAGALPGPVTCPAGTKPYTFKGSTWCFPPDDVVRIPPGNRIGLGTAHLLIKGGGVGKIVHLDAPRLAVPVGTVTWYDAVVRSGWTDAAPTLPPPADQFDQATQGKG
jgi:hypothetical protein